MASSLKRFTMRPWNGSLDKSTDGGLVDPRDFTIAENLYFANSGALKRRGGFTPWSYVAIGVDRASSGTTRTITVTINSGITLTAASDICIFNAGADGYDIETVNIDSITASGANHIITYTATSSLTETTTADTALRVGVRLSAKMLGMHDFWYYDSTNHVKAQKIIGVCSDGTFWAYTNAGSQTPITVTSGALSTTAATCYFAQLGNRLVISFDEYTNEPVIYNPSSNDITAIKNIDFAGNDVTATNPPPNFGVTQVWQNRMWTNNKLNLDQLLYSDVGEPERWNGEGDSGGVEFDAGDSDVGGITPIFAPYKGVLPFAKRNKLYQLSGNDPINYKVDQLSNGLGAESSKATVAVDQDDIFFLSKRGFNSLLASSAFGNFETSFISQKMQTPFNEEIDYAKLNQCAGVYMPEFNSVIWGVNTGATNNNELWLFNILKKNWYIWKVSTDNTLISFVSLAKIENADRTNTYLIGQADAMVYYYNASSDYDGIDTDITLRARTGNLSVTDDISVVKAFKNVGLILKSGTSTFNVSLYTKIDDFSTQLTTIPLSPGGFDLGVDFVLGASPLGGTKLLTFPFVYSIDGYGYSIMLDVQATGDLELFGYIIEFEPAGDQQELDSEGY